MGLLEKSRKKSGKDTDQSAEGANSPDKKKSVGWLGRTFSERTTALADKLDLESQYARLEALTQSADVPPPPKQSLRERAKRFLSGKPSLLTATKPVAADSARPKLSLRQRAAMLIKKMGGSGETGGGDATGGPTAGGTHRTKESTLDLRPEQGDDELPQPAFFPWWSHSDDGELQPQVTFGEEPHPEDFAATERAREELQGAPAESKSTLSEFADTIERITDNLKNLHVQLDAGNFIRDVQAASPGIPAGPVRPESPLISHHVPVETPRSAGGGISAPAAATDFAGQGQTGTVFTPGTAAASSTIPAPPPAPKQEKPSDIFWPKDLPLDLPARDVRLNADGSISVVPGPFQLPYLAEDIAPETGELSHFTRNLKNAELFIAEGELQLTRIIYERLLVKIGDEEAKRKIRANLDALQNYRKSHDWGSFMPVPPWVRNPWQDFKPPTLNVSEMPVEAKSITINIDKGIFDVARASFEQEKKAEKAKDAAAADGADSSLGGEEQEGEGEGDGAEGGEKRSGEERRVAEGDRRKGGVDMRGDGAEDRRKGAGRRAEDLAGAGEEGEAEAGQGEEEEQRAGEDRRQGGVDTRGEGAEDRRSGRDRREDNAAPEPLAADGESEAGEAAAAAPAAQAEAEPPAPQAEAMPDGVMEPPQIPDMSPDGQAVAPEDEGGPGKEKEEENKIQEIRGVLELKTPDQEDTPFLTLTYDFTKIPHAYRLAKDNGIFEYAYYKYKPMLVKAHQFIKRKQITRALNYYRVIREQQIPSEFKHMVDRNIKDITEYLQKYLVTRQN